MTSARAILTALAVALVPVTMTLGQPNRASAERYFPRLMLSCENGRDYPIRIGAVSRLDDMVTGFIQVGRHQGIHIRLMPMGDGYRYSGRDIWFDGVRNEAVLYWGTPAAVACSVIQD